MGTHFAYVSRALEGGFTLPASCKNPTLPFQDMLKFIPGTSNHRVEGERKSNLHFNELDCNTKLHLVHHFQTDDRPPGAGKYSMPDAYSKHSLCGGNVGGRKCRGGPYRTGTKKLFLSSLADLSSSAAAITELHGCSFFFYYYSSYHHAQRSSTGQRKSAKDTSPAVSNSRAHLPWQITHCPLLLPPRAQPMCAQSQHRGTKPQGPRCAQVTQGQQGVLTEAKVPICLMFCS